MAMASRRDGKQAGPRAAEGASPATNGAASRASVRRARERDIVDATRALFDERGMQDAPIEEIARAVGINKALIYRHFASKEELFVLTITHYLDELRAAALGAPDLRGALDEFTRFCL